MARIRTLTFLFAFIILLLSLSAYPSGGNLFLKSSAQLIPSAPSSLRFGFGPTTLGSPQDGVPVYSTFDQMWAESVANQSIDVSLISPSGVTVASSTLQPSSVSLIYTFQSSDPEGVWTIGISSPHGTNSLPMLLVNPENHPLGVSLDYFSLQNGQLNLGFNITQSNDYNIEGCLSAGGASSTVSVLLPVAIGSGSMQVNWNGSTSSSLSLVGSVSQPFTYWYELYYTYAYSGSNTSQLVSRQLQVARTNGALFSQSPGQQNIQLSEQANLRDGRYELRSFFESASGLSVAQSNILITGIPGSQSMVSLDSCNSFSISAPSSFQKSVALTGRPAQWPTEFYYMYEVSGVDALGAFPLNISIAKINFEGAPWNVSLSDMSFSLLSNPAVETSNSYQGSMYVAAAHFPLQVTVVPKFGGQQLRPITMTLASPFAQYSASIPIGRVIAQVTENGVPLSGTAVQLLNLQNQTLGQLNTAIGNVTFYVPSGAYNLRASLGGTADYGQTNVSTFQTSYVSLSFATAAPPPQYGLYALISFLIVGIALNAYFWLAKPAMRKMKIRRLPGNAFT